MAKSSLARRAREAASSLANVPRLTLSTPSFDIIRSSLRSSLVVNSRSTSCNSKANVSSSPRLGRELETTKATEAKRARVELNRLPAPRSTSHTRTTANDVSRSRMSLEHAFNARIRRARAARARRFAPLRAFAKRAKMTSEFDGAKAMANESSSRMRIRTRNGGECVRTKRSMMRGME